MPRYVRWNTGPLDKRVETTIEKVCPPHETSSPWFEVRPHHKCLPWVPSSRMFFFVRPLVAAR